MRDASFIRASLPTLANPLSFVMHRIRRRPHLFEAVDSFTQFVETMFVGKLFMTRKTLIIFCIAMLVLCASSSFAQSGATRPRRVTSAPPVPDDSSSAEESRREATPSTVSNSVDPASNNSNPTTAPNPSNAANSTSTAGAYALLQRKQYEAALKEA